ncbi:hypothetical protein AWB61_21510 [Chromobacterium sp. F49]|uniref:acyl-homoserine-lactone synthase n=1 Tax=Chromobacterium TaxID=535 RepID=UPI0005BA43CE|nr:MULTISPECIES: acyl-homoserine-lactone synthase [Chromobacterium]KZE84794.1 hypothetical protein AWB61_21510 [Chromobacterium sp. F49]MBW7567641.1 GNAT family N-acetyltransferase [Chromobacterium subtsugae]
MKKFYSLQLDGLVLDRVEDESTMLDLLAFRHKIFRENLRWLPVCGNGLDRDEYDAISDNLAICLDGQVVGSVRFCLLIRSGRLGRIRRPVPRQQPYETLRKH